MVLVVKKGQRTFAYVLCPPADILFHKLSDKICPYFLSCLRLIINTFISEYPFIYI